VALGFGFRCGFLGLLHMEIVRSGWSANTTCSSSRRLPPSWYRAVKVDGTVQEVDSPPGLPEPVELDHIGGADHPRDDPPAGEYLGNVLKLCEERRGVQRQMKFVSATRVILEYELPLNEIVLDFYDKLKTASRGYASMDYEFLRFQRSNLVRLDILLNGDKVDALSLIVHRTTPTRRGRTSRSGFGS